MTAQERQASLQRIIDAARNVVRTVQEETQRAAELVDDEETHGGLLELLRGTPDLIQAVELLPVSLLGCATVIASEMRTDGVDELRKRMETLVNERNERTAANHVRDLVPILLACYAEEPAGTLTH